MSTASLPDIPVFDLRLGDADLAAIEDAFRSPRGARERTDAFEHAFAAHLGTRHAIAMPSCSEALRVAYAACGVGPGDEVIVPSFTFVATAAAAVHCGATPVFADIIGLDDPSIDPVSVQGLLTSRTRAVCAVHFAGYPAAADRLGAICDAHGVALIEDAAHAPAGTLAGRSLGSLGRASAFSFFATKVLPVGEGGLLATDDPQVAAFARTCGCTWDEPRAALALSRLRVLGEEVVARRAVTRRYRERLASIPGVRVPWTDAQVADSCCYAMVIMLEDPERQRSLREGLRERHGIQTTLLYPAAHRLSAYRARFGAASLPRTELAARSSVTLPLFAHLDQVDQDRVVDAIAAELGR